LNAPDSGYLDMNVQYAMDWATGKLTYVGTPVAPSSNGANPGFGDVKDFTFFNTTGLMDYGAMPIQCSII
jgi:hypothetical protein